MGVSYMVRGSTSSECQDALDELCAAVGATPTTEPMRASGPGWMARAVKTKAPAGDEGLSVER